MRQTFTAKLETRRGSATQMLPDVPNGTWVIHIDPQERDQGEGKSSISIGFPVLLLSGWVGEPEKIAKRIAEILTEAQL